MDRQNSDFFFSRTRHVHHLLGIVFADGCMEGRERGRKKRVKSGREERREGVKEGQFPQAYPQPSVTEPLLS